MAQNPIYLLNHLIFDNNSQSKYFHSAVLSFKSNIAETNQTGLYMFIKGKDL